MNHLENLSVVSIKYRRDVHKRDFDLKVRSVACAIFLCTFRNEKDFIAVGNSVMLSIMKMRKRGVKY